MRRKWRQRARFSTEAVYNAVVEAEQKGLIPEDACGITINCSVDLQSAAQNLCDAILLGRAAGEPDLAWTVHVYNGKAPAWWSLGFQRRRDAAEHTATA